MAGGRVTTQILKYQALAPPLEWLRCATRTRAWSDGAAVPLGFAFATVCAGACCGYNQLDDEAAWNGLTIHTDSPSPVPSALPSAPSTLTALGEDKLQASPAPPVAGVAGTKRYRRAPAPLASLALRVRQIHAPTNTHTHTSMYVRCATYTHCVTYREDVSRYIPEQRQRPAALHTRP